MKKNIYIPIEILYRELSSRIYLSSIASQAGYRIYLGTKYGIDNLLNQKMNNNNKEGIFFYKSSLFSNKKYIDKIEKVCEHFVVLDEELGPALKSPEFAINNRCIFDSRIKYFFVIGENIKKKILNYDRRFKKNIKVVGWPKFDVYKKKKLKKIILESKQIKKKYGNFYLFSSNFGVLSKKGLKDKLSKIKDLKQFKNFEQKKKELQDNLKDFLKLKKDIKKYCLKKKIIIRPHPSEYYHEDWYSLKRLNSKIDVIYQGESLPWILASDGLIHRGCTTSLDAYLLNKDIYFWKSGRKVKPLEKNLTYVISKKISSLKNLNFFFKNRINKKLINTIQREIKNIHSKDSVYKIIDELNKLHVTPAKKIIIKKKNNSIINFTKKKLKGFLKNNLLLETKLNQKMPEGFNVGKIKKSLEDFSGKRNFSLNKINNHLIKIETK